MAGAPFCTGWPPGEGKKDGGPATPGAFSTLEDGAALLLAATDGGPATAAGLTAAVASVCRLSASSLSFRFCSCRSSQMM